jgi:spermidine synthase
MVGGYTMLLQILVLRECFCLFSGNELSVAVQLGLWLFFTSIGGAVGTLLHERFTPWLYGLLALAGLWAVGGVRIIPILANVPVGMEIGFGLALISLAAALFPLNFIAGAIFPTACRFFGKDNEAKAIGRFYMYEALGAALAGIVFTFFLAGAVRDLNLVVFISAALILAAALVFGLKRLYLSLTTVLVAGGIYGCIIGDFASSLDNYWWQKYQPGSEHVATLETPYQRLDVGRRQDQFTVFSNGVPTFLAEAQEDLLSGYRKADLYLSLHQNPKRILIIGNTEAGLVSRVLEYPVEQVCYITLDPAMLDITKFLTEDSVFGLNSNKFDVITADGRGFLRQSNEAFDIIMLDLPAPITAAQNRFFTVQAFALISKHLAKDGLVIFELPSSSHYISHETTMLLASIFRAVGQVFQDIGIIAGDNMVFVGGINGQIPPLTELSSRFAQRQIDLKLSKKQIVSDIESKKIAFEALYLSQFNEFRRAQQLEQISETKIAANNDNEPVAYYLNLQRWLRQVGLSYPALNKILSTVEEVFVFLKNSWLYLVVGISLVIAVAVRIFTLHPGQKNSTGRVVVAGAILSSGWAGMIGELAIVFTYQNSFGQMYQMIGALFGMYMFGLVFGSATGANRGSTAKRRLIWIAAVRLLMIVTCIVAMLLARIDLEVLFFVVVFVFAFVIGMEYPVANRIYHQDYGGRKAAGILHSMDHLGAAFATFLAGTILLPLIGALSLLFAVMSLHTIVLTTLFVCLQAK